MEQSASVSLSPPESFHQSDRRGLTQGGQDISSLLDPKGEFSHTRKPHKYRVRRRQTVVHLAFSVAGNGGGAVEVATAKTLGGKLTGFHTIQHLFIHLWVFFLIYKCFHLSQLEFFASLRGQQRR